MKHGRQILLMMIWMLWSDQAQSFQLLPSLSRPPFRYHHSKNHQRHRQFSQSQLFDSDDSRVAQNIAGDLSRNLRSAEKDRSNLSRDIARYNEQLARAKAELERLESISVKNQLELNAYERQIQTARSKFVEFQVKSNDARQQLETMENEMKGTTRALQQTSSWTNTASSSLSSSSEYDTKPLDESIVLPSLAGLTVLAAVRSVLQKRPQVQKEQTAESRFSTPKPPETTPPVVEKEGGISPFLTLSGLAVFLAVGSSQEQNVAATAPASLSQTPTEVVTTLQNSRPTSDAAPNMNSFVNGWSKEPQTKEAMNANEGKTSSTGSKSAPRVASTTEPKSETNVVASVDKKQSAAIDANDELKDSPAKSFFSSRSTPAKETLELTKNGESIVSTDAKKISQEDSKRDGRVGAAQAKETIDNNSGNPKSSPVKATATAGSVTDATTEDKLLDKMTTIINSDGSKTTTRESSKAIAPQNEGSIKTSPLNPSNTASKPEDEASLLEKLSTIMNKEQVKPSNLPVDEVEDLVQPETEAKASRVMSKPAQNDQADGSKPGKTPAGKEDVPLKADPKLMVKNEESKPVTKTDSPSEAVRKLAPEEKLLDKLTTIVKSEQSNSVKADAPLKTESSPLPEEKILDTFSTTVTSDQSKSANENAPSKSESNLPAKADAPLEAESKPPPEEKLLDKLSTIVKGEQSSSAKAEAPLKTESKPVSEEKLPDPLSKGEQSKPPSVSLTEPKEVVKTKSTSENDRSNRAADKIFELAPTKVDKPYAPSTSVMAQPQGSVATLDGDVPVKNRDAVAAAAALLVGTVVGTGFVAVNAYRAVADWVSDNYTATNAVNSTIVQPEAFPLSSVPSKTNDNDKEQNGRFFDGFFQKKDSGSENRDKKKRNSAEDSPGVFGFLNKGKSNLDEKSKADSTEPRWSGTTLGNEQAKTTDSNKPDAAREETAKWGGSAFDTKSSGSTSDRLSKTLSESQPKWAGSMWSPDATTGSASAEKKELTPTPPKDPPTWTKSDLSNEQSSGTGEQTAWAGSVWSPGGRTGTSGTEMKEVEPSPPKWSASGSNPSKKPNETGGRAKWAGSMWSPGSTSATTASENDEKGDSDDANASPKWAGTIWSPGGSPTATSDPSNTNSQPVNPVKASDTANTVNESQNPMQNSEPSLSSQSTNLPKARVNTDQSSTQLQNVVTPELPKSDMKDKTTPPPSKPATSIGSLGDLAGPPRKPMTKPPLPTKSANNGLGDLVTPPRPVVRPTRSVPSVPPPVPPPAPPATGLPGTAYDNTPADWSPEAMMRPLNRPNPGAINPQTPQTPYQQQSNSYDQRTEEPPPRSVAQPLIRNPSQSPANAPPRPSMDPYEKKIMELMEEKRRRREERKARYD